jgi:quercetin dioxygenase-like cupin family protein
MKITRVNQNPTHDNSSEFLQQTSKHIKGVVWQELIIDAPLPARVQAKRVTFAAGAHTMWHTHPLGQTLYVLSGSGLVQRESGPLMEIRPGDIVWIEPHENHWHGAGPTTSMCHLAIQESENGKTHAWFGSVTDAEYNAKANYDT